MGRRKHRADGGELPDSVGAISPLQQYQKRGSEKIKSLRDVLDVLPGGGFNRDTHEMRDSNAIQRDRINRQFGQKSGGRVKKKRKIGGKVIGLMTGGAVRPRLDRRARSA